MLVLLLLLLLLLLFQLAFDPLELSNPSLRPLQIGARILGLGVYPHALHKQGPRFDEPLDQTPHDLHRVLGLGIGRRATASGRAAGDRCRSLRLRAFALLEDPAAQRTLGLEQLQRPETVDRTQANRTGCSATRAHQGLARFVQTPGSVLGQRWERLDEFQQLGLHEGPQEPSSQPHESPLVLQQEISKRSVRQRLGRLERRSVLPCERGVQHRAHRLARRARPQLDPNGVRDGLVAEDHSAQSQPEEDRQQLHAPTARRALAVPVRRSRRAPSASASTKATASGHW